MTPREAGPRPPLLPSLTSHPFPLQSGGPTRPAQLHTSQVRGTPGPGTGEGGEGQAGHFTLWLHPMAICACPAREPVLLSRACVPKCPRTGLSVAHVLALHTDPQGSINHVPVYPSPRVPCRVSHECPSLCSMPHVHPYPLVGINVHVSCHLNVRVSVILLL